MDKSAEQPIRMPQSFPINNNNVIINNNEKPFGNPPYPNINQPPAEIVNNQIQPQVINVVATQFGTKPISITCQFCKIPITTNVARSFNFCSCLLWFYTSLLFWICFQACRGKEMNCLNAKHTCPNCGQVLGYYSSCWLKRMNI